MGKFKQAGCIYNIVTNTMQTKEDLFNYSGNNCYLKVTSS